MKAKNLPHSQKMKLVKYITAEHQVKSKGAGNVRLKIKLPRNASNGIRLRDIMPEFRNNLMSNMTNISNMTDNDYVVIFRENSAIVKRPDESMTAVFVFVN